MANKEYEEILRGGARRWNPWRERHPTAELDFRGCHWEKWRLENCDLSNADLRGAKLHRAYLNGANLSGASLADGDLRAADLSGVNLTSGNLYCADLRDAKLRGADLRGSRLYKAILVGADLRGADLSDAEIGSTIFGNTDLSAVKGLHLVRHRGTSIVDLSSIVLHSGDLPTVFLRRIGLSLQFIRRLKYREPSSSSCFLSYSTKDSKFVKRLFRSLEDAGFDCWFAPDDMKTGDRILTRIEDAIHNHDHLIIVISQNSLRSAWVEKEVSIARKKERGLTNEQRSRARILVPIDLDGLVVHKRKGWAAKLHRDCHVDDFQHWQNNTSYNKALKKLIHALRPDTKYRPHR